MIKEDSFKKERILEFKKTEAMKRIDPGLAEKMIYALHLVETLKIENCNFIFKGGTSLILLLNKPRRFSIDVDIMTEHSRNEIEEILNRIIKNYEFVRFELDETRSYQTEGIPKAHYYIYFGSQLTDKEERIMLDIIFMSNFYPNVKEVSLKCDFIICDGTHTPIKIPTLNSISGDKLTAFAPNTSGYPFNKELGLQIIKQLFDLGHLFDEIDDFNELAKCVENKIEVCNYHLSNKFDKYQILDDIIDTSILITKNENRLNDIELNGYKELRNGIDQIANYLIERNFRFDIAVEHAAKVALIAAKVKMGALETMDEFDPAKDYRIDSKDYEYLNKKLKKVPTKSLFYFNQALKLLDR